MDKSSQEIATVDNKAHLGKRKKIDGTRRITYRAVLVALALVLKLVGQVLQFGSFKITFVYMPWIISAIAMGPLGGMTVVFLTDLIGTFILSTGGFPLPLLVLSNALMGLLMGLAFKIPKIDPRLKLLIGTVAITLICTLGISTFELARVYGLPFKVEFVIRLSTQVPVLVLNAVIVGFLLPLLKKLGLMD
ncbi:MAG: folate family ECF transporter S component [Clostridiales bacterium]|nr:folate family ECF transporter S component [Clostridiales bacterium]